MACESSAGARPNRWQEPVVNAPTLDGPADTKAVSTLVARAALAGYELVRLADGSFAICRWGLIRALATVADVEIFLELAGVP